jgi:hypothetical protein
MPQIISRLRKGLTRWKKRRKERPQKLAFHVGEQDQLDFVTYSGLEEQQYAFRLDPIHRE